MDVLVRSLVFLLGFVLVARTLYSAIRTFVLPRGANTRLTRWVFQTMRRLFNLRLRRARTYEQRDSLLALYAPLGLMALPVVWLALVLLGYMAMYWAVGAPSLGDAFLVSGSSLLTLGSVLARDTGSALLEFSEAAIGLILIALFIAYLPTIYAAFARREREVAMLEVRAGAPPSAVEMIKRYYRIHGLDQLGAVWQIWEEWFSDIEESHTSLAVLPFFRSPQPGRSWITAAGAVLDAASLVRSTVDVPADPQADLCIRAGFLALRSIAGFFGITYPADPHFPATSISVTRAEYDAACADLEAQGVPLIADREQAWSDFAGWRVNYDVVLVALCVLVTAPEAPWSSDKPRRATRGRA